MENLKKVIKAKLNEANYMVKPEDLDDIVNKLNKDDVVKLVDEANDENNPWAICTASVGREDKAKYERCVKDVKKKHGIEEEDGEAVEAEPQRDTADLQRDVQKFLDKLNLGQFETIIARIDKPIEKLELLAAFGERIGIPRSKLPVLIQQLRQTAESEITEGSSQVKQMSAIIANAPEALRSELTDIANASLEELGKWVKVDQSTLNKNYKGNLDKMKLDLIKTWSKARPKQAFEGVKPKMTKNELIETVIKTVKVKDIKNG